jgi:hypothetical protein
MVLDVCRERVAEVVLPLGTIRLRHSSSMDRIRVCIGLARRDQGHPDTGVSEAVLHIAAPLAVTIVDYRLRHAHRDWLWDRQCPDHLLHEQRICKWLSA